MLSQIALHNLQKHGQQVAEGTKHDKPRYVKPEYQVIAYVFPIGYVRFSQYLNGSFWSNLIDICKHYNNGEELITYTNMGHPFPVFLDGLNSMNTHSELINYVKSSGFWAE